MSGFFSLQMDYIFLFYGLAFILLAGVVYSSPYRRDSAMPWKWLALFGLSHGINEWLEMLALSQGDSLPYTALRILLMAASFLCLVEFGRAGTSAIDGKAPGRWIFLPLLALAASGIMEGLAGTNVSARYALGFTGGLWTAWVLLQYRRQKYPESRSLLVAGWAMILYAIVTGLIVPKVPFFPASMLNHGSFLAVTGFPIQLLRGLLAVAIAMSLWLYTENTSRESRELQGHQHKIDLLLVILLCSLLIAGWVATQHVGSIVDLEERTHILERAHSGAAAINELRVIGLTGSQADLKNPDYVRLKEQLIRLRQSIKDVRFYYLLGKSGEKIFFMVDSEPETSKDYSPPGQIYEEASQTLRGIFETGKPITEGPVADRWGTWISGLAPIRTGDGRVIAVLGVDIDASPLAQKIAQQRLTPILITMLLSLIFVLFYVALQRGRDARKAIERVAGEQSLLLDTIDTQVWYLEDAQTYGAVNDAHAAFLGRHKAFLEHKSLLDIFPEDIAREYINVNKRAFAEKRSTYTEEWMTKAQGEKRLLVITRTPKLDLAGNIEYMVCSAEDITERKLIENTLRERKDRLTSIFRASPVGIGIFVNRMISEVNDTLCSMLGYDRDELVGQSTSFLYLNQADYEEVGAAYRQLTEGNRGKVETRFSRKDGSILNVILGFSAIDPGDLDIGVTFTVLDITERKRAEEALQESEEKHRLLIENSHDIIYTLTPEGVFTFVSPAWTVLLGHPVSQVYGQPFQQFVHPDDLAGCMVFLHAAIDTGQRQEGVEYRVRHIDGSWHWHTSSAVPLRDESGTVICFEGTARDITESKQAEEALKKSEERFKQLSEVFPETIFESDLEGYVTYANKNGLECFGYTEEDFLSGMNIFNLVSPDYRDQVLMRIKEKIQGIDNGYLEYQALRKDGSTFHAMGYSVPIIINKKPVGVRGFVLDITAQKQAEAELRETNHQLEVATIRANDMAAQAAMANMAKSEFLANMSHEIRTPMNGVIGMTGLLLDTELTPEQRQFAEIVRSSGETLLSLINDILDFSKIEANKIELETLDFDLRTLIEDTAEMLSTKANEKNLEIICLVEPDVPSWLRGDPGRLRQILVNLAGNAMKFTHKGEISIRAKVESEHDNKVVVLFSVTDTGIGIPEERISALFSPFVQADGSTTRKYGGTGLGLAISKQLAELMGGNIGVQSEEGKGSTFWFTIVLEKQLEGGRPVIEPLADLRGAKVLVVDDNETNLFLVATLLKSWGCRYKEAPGGEVALSRLHDAAQCGDPFQVALVDLAMSGMDGEELGQRIKGEPEIRSTLMIMMTSLGQRGDAARLEKIGFSGYLTKPVRQSQLRECLALVLGKNIQKGEGSSQNLVTRHTIAESRKGRVRVLLAEDNPTNQVVALTILKKLGYRADAVANGDEAVKALQDIPYDLVLMDCQMPEMDGYEATRCIRNPETGVINPAVPIIAMTANAMKGDRDKCLDAGMNDYLAKPILPGDLAEAIARWLGKTSPDTDPVSMQPAMGIDGKGSGHEDEDIFHAGELINRLMGDEELARTILAGFLEDIPKQIAALKGYLAVGDAPAVHRQGHTIKGAAAAVGGGMLREAALKIEQAGKAGDLNRAALILPSVKEQFRILKEIIKRTGWA
jgi:PAS domain S-box-containing protein